MNKIKAIISILFADKWAVFTYEETLKIRCGPHFQCFDGTFQRSVITSSN